MATVRIYGRQVEVPNEGIAVTMFDFSPLPASDRGTSRVLDVEVPEGMQVEDIGLGYKAIPVGNGQHISAQEVMMRIAKSEDGYRVVKAESA